MPKPGVRMVADRPKRKAPSLPIVKLELGKAYTARKGSNLRWQFGTDAIYMVTALPPVVTTSSIVQVLGPRGVVLCYAVDLRPCEEVRLEDEE
jgi:hypothetical protein